MARLIQPVQGRISSAFGVNRGDHMHGGVDIAASCGTPIQAAAAGRVTTARYSDTAGNMIVLDHGGGFDTRYFHLSRFAVSPGAYVQAGEVIGYVGNTGRSSGCHLHWEVRQDGRPINPLTAAAPNVAAPAPVLTAPTITGDNSPFVVMASGGDQDRDDEGSGSGVALAALALLAVWLIFS